MHGRLKDKEVEDLQIVEEKDGVEKTERAIIDVKGETGSPIDIIQTEGAKRQEVETTIDEFDEDDEGLAYGNVNDIEDEGLQDLDGLDYGESLSRVTSSTEGTTLERAIDVGLIDAGHTISDHGNSDTESASDDTIDGYDADSSEAEPGPGPAFNRSRYGQVTGGMSEMSLFDTAVCVGFGYALVYAV